MEVGNATGDRGVRDPDAKISVQKGLAALSHWVINIYRAIWYNYNND